MYRGSLHISYGPLPSFVTSSPTCEVFLIKPNQPKELLAKLYIDTIYDFCYSNGLIAISLSNLKRLSYNIELYGFDVWSSFKNIGIECHC